MGILQLNLVLSPSVLFPCYILSSSFKMSVPIIYCASVTPKPYTLAPTPPSLTFEEYKALAIEQSTVEEAHMERLRKEKEACQLKVELLRQEILEAERKVEEKRLEEEQKAEEKRKEDERVAKELQEKEEAVEHKWLADLKEMEDKEKERKKKKRMRPMKWHCRLQVLCQQVMGILRQIQRSKDGHHG